MVQSEIIIEVDVINSINLTNMNVMFILYINMWSQNYNILMFNIV